MSIASPLTQPSPNGRRVGIRIVTFEACSGFTHVTARRIAQPPTGDLCHEAPTLAVTRTSRSSATGSIDNSPGGILPPLMIRAFGAHCHFRTHAPQQTTPVAAGTRVASRSPFAAAAQTLDASATPAGCRDNYFLAMQDSIPANPDRIANPGSEKADRAGAVQATDETQTAKFSNGDELTVNGPGEQSSISAQREQHSAGATMLDLTTGSEKGESPESRHYRDPI